MLLYLTFAGVQFSPDHFFRILNKCIFKLILKEIRHQSASHIESFLSVVVSVILIDFSQKGIK